MAIFGISKEKFDETTKELNKYRALSSELESKLKDLSFQLENLQKENTEIKKQLDTFANIKNSLSTAFIMFDKELNIIDASRAAVSFFNTDVQNKKCYEVFDSQFCNKHCSISNCIGLKIKSKENKIVPLGKNKQIAIIDFNTLKNSDGTLSGAYLFFKDITALIEKEKEHISQLTEHISDNKNLLRVPKTVQETGLQFNFIADLVLKILYQYGNLSGEEISNIVCLPFYNTVESVLEFLKNEMKHCYTLPVKDNVYEGPAKLVYKITDLGMHHARELMEKDQYVGPAPVPLETYTKVILNQKKQRELIDREKLKNALGTLVIDDSLLKTLTVAINSGESIFMYGRPGNGKTTIAKCCGTLSRKSVLVPYAIEVGNQVIKVFDPAYHVKIDSTEQIGDFLFSNGYIEQSVSIKKEAKDSFDRRWAICKSPFIAVGGELTLNELDLIYNPITKFYEAPFQIKANGGVLLIDDFGRQRVRPEDLLNRWIVPLEEKIDYMTLVTGKKIVIPIDQTVIFSTNLKASDLGDEAFFRRLKNKIYVKNPSMEQFIEIFKLNCQRYNFNYTPEIAQYLIRKIKNSGMGLRAYFPRDVLLNARSLADISGENQRDLSTALIDEAFKNCFLETEEE